MKQTFRVAEFAKLAGVTVRTLHYYDRIDLLKPSDTTSTGHRLYRRGDLVRLQQILTLKWMGFELAHIKSMLDSPSYNLRQALIAQKAVVDEQIQRLSEASTALERALNATERVGEDMLSSDGIYTILRAVTQSEANQLFRKYYSDEAWHSIETRALSFTPADQERAQQDWEQLYADFHAMRDESPDHPAVQKLAKKMHDLIESFTGGDSEVEAGLKRVVSDRENLPEEHRPFSDSDLQPFIMQALDIYRSKKR